MHSLSLRTCVKPSLTKLTVNTIELNTTEWSPRIAILRAINPHHPSLDLSHNAMAALQIVREDRRAKTVGSVVSSINGGCYL
jgi:hypothetical protein